jgi:hypothetical protein
MSTTSLAFVSILAVAGSLAAQDPNLTPARILAR